MKPKVVLVLLILFELCAGLFGGNVVDLLQGTARRCDQSILQLPVEYNAEEKSLQPIDRSCTLSLLSAAESKYLLRDQWLIFVGGSVTHVNVRRILSYLLTNGQDLSFFAENCTNANQTGLGHNPYLHNLDFIWRPDGKVLRRETETYRYGFGFDKNNVTEGIRSNVAFFNEGSRLVNSFVASQKGKSTGHWMRISVIDDRYMAITPGLLNALFLQHKAPKVFHGSINIVAGPIGAWYFLCFHNVDNEPYMCPNKALKRHSKASIYQAYGNATTKFFTSLQQLRNASILSNAIVSAFRKGSFDRVLNASYHSVIAANNHNRSETSARNILIPALHITEALTKVEFFDGHPAPIASLWEWSALMAAMKFDQRRPAFATVNNLGKSLKFSNECSIAYMLEYPEKKYWDTSLTIPGCSLLHSIHTVDGTANRDQVVVLSSCEGRQKSTEEWNAWNSLPSNKGNATKRVSTIQQPITFPVTQDASFAASFDARKFILACLCFYVLVKHCSSSDDENTKTTTAMISAKPVTNRISGLGFARYLASIHIVLGHLQARGLFSHTNASWQYFSSWGFTWVPFFFILSGFILTFSKLQKLSKTQVQFVVVRDDDQATIPSSVFAWKWDGQFMQQRLADIYPTYFTGLLISFCLQFVYQSTHQTTANMTTNMVVEIFLLQSWIPFTLEKCLQVQCWFLSCQIFYWLLFPTLFHTLIRLRSTKTLLICCATCAITVPFIVSIFIPVMLGLPSDWYVVTKASPATHVMLISILKFSPFSFLHLFLLGMLLAVLYTRIEEEASVKDKKVADLESDVDSSTGHLPSIGNRLLSDYLVPVVKYGGVTLAYFILLLIFLFPSLQPFGWKISCRLGLLAPMYAMVLIGLSYSYDPLCKLFQHDVFVKLGNISYAQYILQFIVLRCTPYKELSSWPDLCLYFLCLNAASVLLFHSVQIPLKNVAKFTIWLSIGMPSTLLLLLMVSLLLPQSFVGRNNAIHQNHTKTPKGFVRLDAWSYDMKLNLSTTSSLPYAIINPSLMMTHDGKLIVSARKHRLEARQFQIQYGENSKPVTVLEYIYHSALLLGELDPITLHQRSPLTNMIVPRPERSNTVNELQIQPLSKTAWIPCLEPSVYFSYNQTLVKVVTTGPQDPRLIERRQGSKAVVAMSFFSMIPTSQPDTTCRLNDPNNNNLIGRPYFSNVLLGNSTSSGKVVDISVIPLAKNLQDQTVGDNGVEKNWLLFEVPGKNSESTMMLFAVHTFYPKHIVFNVYDVNAVFETDSSVIMRQLSTSTSLVVHGGANPISVKWLGVEVLLSSFHTLDYHPDPACPKDHQQCRHTHPTYRHYLYILQASPPFRILNISKPLILQEFSNAPGITFVSSLVLWKSPSLALEHLLVSYGSGDQESRVLVMTKEKVLQLFDIK